MSEEFLPKWTPQTKTELSVLARTVKVLLIICVYVFTLGIVIMAQHGSDGVKGNH